MDNFEFLARIRWEERWVTLEANGTLDLPAYAGSTIRGALGHVMRPELCGKRGACGEQCQQPDHCPFFSLFEQSRAGGNTGRNIPKPLILETPLEERLRAIAYGGDITEPYELRAGTPLPVLANGWRIGVGDGGRMEIGLRAVGQAGGALDGIVEGIRKQGLEVKGGCLRLVGVRESRGTLECGKAEGGRRLRLALVTPLLIDGGSKETCFAPEKLGRLILNRAFVRAADIYNAFVARKEHERIPFHQPEWPGVVMTSYRLFRYELPRRSYRQGRWMDFDGVVGWMEWEGEVQRVLPWLRAAELLHLGQKATFGLGKVEVMS